MNSPDRVESVDYWHDIDPEYIQSLVAKGGPCEVDDDEFAAWMARAHALVRGGQLSAEAVGELRKAFGEAISLQTMQGFALNKPHGYAGDYEIIDRIYASWVSPDPALSNWDRFFHRQAGARAVRNRKTYFHRLLDLHARTGAFRCLKVGVGPGRSMFEWLSANPLQLVKFDCIEIDPKAIEYAAELNRRFADRVSFIRTNCRRYKPDQSYRLIWAAGIFDYFDDDVFRQMLGNLLPAVAGGGELVIGNFADTNPSRPYMEFGEWFLHHRGADRLVQLAEQSGVPRSRIRIGCEQLGVNLFLHIAA